ncbi:hypothetical protein M408DRAFT_91900 [Serendipita vermifera MAFF 305830]|uniref:Uncharacterized protein n=1 Tax=Serendipita vermifera MAFF 305830 TaxID=933852 RepID=A0A0C3BS34_SERVB|nr:hypothetical protein M408DRAFT_91900 [Serendipita vermifera MAFF 305830]
MLNAMQLCCASLMLCSISHLTVIMSITLWGGIILVCSSNPYQDNRSSPAAVRVRLTPTQIRVDRRGSISRSPSPTVTQVNNRTEALSRILWDHRPNYGATDEAPSYYSSLILLIQK